MLKLIVWPLVRMVEIGGIERIRPRERVVDLRLLILALSYLITLVVAGHQAQLVFVVFILVICATLNCIFVTGVCPPVVPVIIDICCVDLLIALNELIHLLGFLVEYAPAALAAGALHLHLLLKHHDLILLLGILVLIVRRHVQPLMVQHGLGRCALVRIPLQHRHEEIR